MSAPAQPKDQAGGDAAAAVLDAPYSVVLTSCGRFDLLAETVASFLNHMDEAPEAFIVAEDTGDAAAAEALKPLEPALGKPFTVLLNRPQLGQMRSIDKAYGEVTTPLVFHCEDDWEFFRTGFIAESRRILAARPEISMVGLRPRLELNPRVRDSAPLTLEDGRPGGAVPYFELDPSLHPEYFSYSFNPGLRRMSDARAIGPFAPIGREEDVSYAFKKQGFRIANLEAPAVRHLGDGRHVLDPTSKPKPRNFLERLQRSANKRLKRIRRKLGGG